MIPVIDQLEERVTAVAALVKNLRAEVVRLERELAASPVAPAHPTPPAPATGDESLREEIALLRAEREVVRERVSGLIREIDQVSW